STNISARSGIRAAFAISERIAGGLLSPPLQRHRHAVARSQSNETLRFDRMPALEAEPIVLPNRCQDQNRLGHGKSRADANALAGAKWNIAEPRRLGAKSLRIETMRVGPQRCLAVEKPGRNEDDRAARNTLAEHFIVGNRLARHR